MGPGALSDILRRLPQKHDPRLLVGVDTSDDAGVYKLDDNTALIQTLDFFTPIVDDPFLFGQIAAANSLSDVYAMGGRPLTAMNIVTFPLNCMDLEVLYEILRGGQAKIDEAGALMVGGHTIEDEEPKYGLSVTGIVHPDKVLANSKAKTGDALVLTKALGTGILFTAAKAELFEKGVAEAAKAMATLNKAAAEVMADFPVNACTDITGFGFLGHAAELSAGSGKDLEIDSPVIPMLADAAEAARMGLIPAGAYSNRAYLSGVSFDPLVAENIRDVLYDPQTSGGLLISLPENRAGELVAALKAAGVFSAAVVGRVKSSGEGRIHVR